jgi:hypothetical protein
VSASGKKHRFSFRSVRDNLYKVFGTQSAVAMLSPSLRGMPFSGVEWTYQARDLGFKQEIESDDEEEGINLPQLQTSTSARINTVEELEMSDLTGLDGGLKKIH